MQRIGLRFIGVVKTATKKFPMAYLSGIEMRERGEWKGVVSKDEDGNPNMLAFCWMDRDRRYFISSCSSLDAGTPYSRTRWRQVDTADSANPERVELTIPQPKCAETYYNTCGLIDRHNRCRQDDLKIEKKLRTTKWDVRVNMSIFAMIVVDTWLVYSKCTTMETTEKQIDFYTCLAEEMIDNTYDSLGGRRGRTTEVPNRDDESPVMSRRTGMPQSGVYAHLTPTKRKRNTRDGEPTKQRLQGRCMMCQKKTTYLCSTCNDDMEENQADSDGQKTPWLCHTEKGQTCFAEHYDSTHIVLEP